MPKARKTKEEKVKSQYRLANFSLQLKETEVRRDKEEFGYLASEYVVRDLGKTFIFTVVILTLLFLARTYLG